MGKRTIKISQCMIVKNEEDNIIRALSWGRDIMWEQIVVDTGSIDRTVELAKSMGAKVFHFDWIDDFAAAKNYALKQASGDWIAFLDADEFLAEEWVHKLPELLDELTDSPYYALRSPLVCIDENGNITSTTRHCRFFRNLPGICYKGAIHEILAIDGNSLQSGQVIDAEVEYPVYHTGYRPEEMEKKEKRQRNIRILEKQLKINPKDYNVMGYMGDAYKGLSGEEEAAKWYRKAIALMPDRIHVRDDRSVATFVYLLLILSNQEEGKEFLKVYETAIQKIPWAYDCDFIAGKFYLEKKDCRKAIFHLERALQIVEQYGTTAYGLFLDSNVAAVWEKLAQCHYELKNLAECTRYCVILLKADRRRTSAMTMLLTALEREKPEEIVRFLGKLYDIHQPSDRIFLLKGAILAKAQGVLEVLKKECTQQELDYLAQLEV